MKSTLKATTIKGYSTPQIWNAVIRRTDDYRFEPSGIYRLSGDAYHYHASYYHDRRRAIDALLDVVVVRPYCDRRDL